MPLPFKANTSWTPSSDWVWSGDNKTIWERKSWGWAEWNWLDSTKEWKKKNTRGIRSANSREYRIDRGSLKRRLNLPPGIQREELELLLEQDLHEREHYKAEPKREDAGETATSSSSQFVSLRVAPKIEDTDPASLNLAPKRKSKQKTRKETKEEKEEDEYSYTYTYSSEEEEERSEKPAEAGVSSARTPSPPIWPFPPTPENIPGEIAKEEKRSGSPDSYCSNSSAEQYPRDWQELERLNKRKEPNTQNQNSSSVRLESSAESSA